MNLTIDIGNTRTKVGVFSEMQLVEDWSVDRLSIVTVRKIIKQYKIQYSIVSSTKLISDKLLEVLKSQ
ncbi:MAG: type III pantothenate kinase, partial [Bacteroidetes bacterium]|nr:type III pantothenate kinase [Bacteroidota bacterium]